MIQQDPVGHSGRHLQNRRMQKWSMESLENFGRLLRPPAQHIIRLEPHSEVTQCRGQGRCA